MGALRGVCFGAREKVCNRRDSSNSAPKWPSPGAAAAHSRRPPRVAGAAARLQTAADGTGSTPYLLGHAADATRTAAALSADRRTSAATDTHGRSSQSIDTLTSPGPPTLYTSASFLRTPPYITYLGSVRKRLRVADVLQYAIPVGL